MALLLMIVRKMAKNKWLELSLLFGLVVSVALVSSMPMYTDAILQRMLLKDLQKQQMNTNEFPGSVRVISSPNSGEDDARSREQLQATDRFIASQVGSFGMPVRMFVRTRSTGYVNFVPADPAKIDGTVHRTGELSAIEGLEEHTKLVDGRLPAKEPVNGVYEALATEQLMSKFKLVLGHELTFKSHGGKTPIRVKPVGIIEEKEAHDVYWFMPLSEFSTSFLVDYQLFERDFTQEGKMTAGMSGWFYALDYDRIQLSSIGPFLKTSDRIKTYMEEHHISQAVKVPALQTVEAYFDNAKRLRVLLWSLNVPVLMLLVFYLFMVSNLITDKQKTEIAVLRSRGAARWQIIAAFALEGVLLGAIAFAVGPPLGLLLTELLGASNGFLEFVQRATLDVKVTPEAYRDALYAVIASVLMTLIPVILATRASIVNHKQQMARRNRLSLWHRFGLDIILLAVALYGWNSFRRRMQDLQALGLDSIDFKVDPLLFIVPACFILAVGLLILRLYPLFVRGVYVLGRRWWPPSLYATMIQVGRSGSQYQFIMVFLILTIATGLYSASAARTINQNAEDKLSYAGGADLRLQIQWPNDAPPQAIPGDPSGSGAAGGGAAGPKRIQYTEPPFTPFTELPGVAHAAKVFMRQEAYVSAGKMNVQATLFGIDTDDFGRVAWMRDGLLAHHFNEYLNVMASDPTAVLISQSLADEHGIQPGDHVMIGWNGGQGAQVNVYGILPYWPSWNPNPTLSVGSSSNSKSKPKPPNLVVGHLSYIQNEMALEPYDVWLKMKPGASTKELYDAIEERQLPIVQLNDTHQALIAAKSDPFRLAVNGVMTLGFVISTGISFIGFLLYWVLSLSGRTLQFGILRAMGISFGQLLGMLVTEQALTSGAAVLLGAGVGKAVSHLFVPLFQLSFDTVSQAPPFRVTFDPSDSLKLFVIVSVMIGSGLVLLGLLLSRIRIHQAVKLGED
jgi:putative ABC transport system permease protein